MPLLSHSTSNSGREFEDFPSPRLHRDCIPLCVLCLPSCDLGCHLPLPSQASGSSSFSLFCIFQFSLSTGSFPSAYTFAIISPIVRWKKMLLYPVSFLVMTYFSPPIKAKLLEGAVIFFLECTQAFSPSLPSAEGAFAKVTNDPVFLTPVVISHTSSCLTSLPTASDAPSFSNSL